MSTPPVIAPAHLMAPWLAQEMSAAGATAKAKPQGGLSEGAKIALGVGGGLIGLGALFGGIWAATHAGPPQWDAKKQYNVGDVVALGPATFKALQQNKGYSPDMFIGTSWDCLSPVWDTSKSYQTGDIVSYAALTFKALQPNTGMDPSQDPAYQQYGNGINWVRLSPWPTASTSPQQQPSAASSQLQPYPQQAQPQQPITVYPSPVSKTDPFGIGTLQSPYATYQAPPPPDPFGTGTVQLQSPVSQSAQAFAPPSTFIPSLTLSPQFASTPAPSAPPPPSVPVSSSIPSLSASIPSLHMAGYGWYSPYEYGGKDL